MAVQKSKPTIEDVANHCGVSVATVSRVVNKSNPVSKELDEKVRKAIKELSFTPRQWTARTKSDTIAITIPDILNPFYSMILHGAQEEADRHDFNLVILNLRPGHKRQKKYLSMLTQAKFAGLIVVGSRIESEYLVELKEQYIIPIVAAVRTVEDPQFPCIMFDDESPMYQATKHLIDLNHRRIAFISGPLEWDSTQARLNGIQRALSEAGLSLPDAFRTWGYSNTENGVQLTSNLLNLPESERPTAIIGHNDLVAIGALHAIRLAGLRVPDDISVVGFDDISMAAYTNPPLTTVTHPKYRMGQLAVQILVDQLNNVESLTGGVTMLECPLVLRGSTAPCVKSQASLPSFS
ncbi:MAG: LacI family transcriptional regulator [bacterium]|nr:LacI family transcriptional regulator [bacterium]